MNVSISPQAEIQGKLQAISSKSMAHRVLICASLAEETQQIKIRTSSADIEATVSCLKALGADIIKSGTDYTVQPITLGQSAVADCRESGSTLRFLIPVVSALGLNCTFTGCGRLPQRPIYQLLNTLKKNDAEFSSDTLPFTASGKLKSGDYEITGDVSSQFISGLLFALPLLDGDSRIILSSPLQSASYVDMTIDAMKSFGVYAQKTAWGFYVSGNQKYKSHDTAVIEGDWSNAAFILTAAAIGGNVSLYDLNEKSSQSDKEILNVIKNFGADVSYDGTYYRVCKNKCLPLSVDVSQIPDLFPIISVLCAASNGKSVLYNASRLRIKESDRLEATKALLISLGGKAEISDDSLIIYGSGRLKGGTVDSFNDHRIAMSAAVASVICDNAVTVTDMQAINKSYPDFINDFNSIGGKINVL